MAEIRQGGKSWFHLAVQPDAETLISDIAKVSRFKRQSLNFGLDVDGEQLQSEAIRGNVDASKSQSGAMWGGGPIETELYVSNSLDYVQAVLNGDPKTKSTDVAKTTVYDGKFTPKGEQTGTTVVTTSGDDPGLTIVQPTTPGQLKITLDGASGPARVIGRRKRGPGSLDVIPMAETVTLDGTSHTGTTEGYYHYVDSLEFPNTGLTIDTDIDLDIVAEPGLKKTVFSARDAIFPGWTVQGVVGGEPRLGFGVVPVRTRLDVGRNIRLAMETLARMVWRRRTLVGGVFTEKFADDSDLKDDAFIPNVFFPYYGGYMEIDDNPTVFKNFRLDINQGLNFLEGSTGSPSRLPMSRGNAGRDVSASFSVYYAEASAATEDFIKWDERFRDNITSEVVIYMYYWTVAGKEYYHKITLGEVELTGVPRIPANTKGALEESLALRAVREGATAVVTWEVVDDAGWTVAA